MKVLMLCMRASLEITHQVHRPIEESRTMAFWGLELKAGKTADLGLTRRLVIKQAALVVNTPAKKQEPCVLSLHADCNCALILHFGGFALH
eukprot:2036223-Pleurochrysis_carterae.AAC.3